MRLFPISLFVLAFVAYSCESSSRKANQDDESLVGSWRLIADQQTDDAGNVSQQDTAVSGLLLYTPEGKMSAQLVWNGTRNQIMSDTIMNHDGISYGTGLGINTWTREQARTIIDTYDAYFGDYVIDWKNQVITHSITGNLRPEKPGTIYKRRFQLKGDTLLLRSTDSKMKWQVAWVKIKNAVGPPEK